jgi:formylglycine-generating enzyme required for sulfatase activity
LAATDRQLETMQAPHQLQQDIPDTLSSAIMLALNVKPEDRFQTVAEFRSALNPLKNEKPALEQSPAAPEKQKTEGRGKKYRALLWLGAALVFIAATAYFISNNKGKSDNQKSDSTEHLNPVIESLIKNMVEVEGGTFTMGCTSEQGNNCKKNEIPMHSVQLNSFYIGRFEVTQEQWDAVMGSNPSRFNDCADCPVENISWDDAQYFINKLNSMTEKEFRLPTEAEWEYAARGGKNSKGFKYAGSDEIALVAWHGRNSGNRTHKVGEKIPNELGLYDMTGNVWEWCSDWYAEDYYSNSPKNNPTGPAFGTYRVLRGGSWYDLYPVNSRISYRLTGASETAREYNFGLRLVCEDL